jgi:excisionase family DNA binding protein
MGTVMPTPDGTPAPAVCDYKEAMELTALKKTKLYDLFARGVLRGYRDGTMIRFYRASLLAYMKERENAPPAPKPPLRKPRKGRAPNGTRFKFL